jgi:hypothetical protein
MELLWRMGYQSQFSQEHLTDRKKKNAFYEAVGRLIPPTVDLEHIEINTIGTPQQVLQELQKQFKE